MISDDYIKNLELRVKSNRIVQEFQDTALAIAEMLNDKKHIALYMKIAKNHPKSDLLRIAKDVAGRTKIEHKGAYFMKIIQKEGLLSKNTNATNKSKKTKSN